MTIGVKCTVGAAISGLVLGAAALAPAAAAERAAINTGLTSFYDGFGGATPGCAYVQYLGNASYNALNDGNGDKLADWDLKSTYVAGQIACTTSTEVLGGLLGWTVIAGGGGQDANPLSTNGFGISDTAGALSLSFPMVMSGGRPVFAHAISIGLDAPTGKYDAGKAVNPGNDYWSTEAFWKATWLPAPGLEVSWRLNYIHNFDHRSETNVAGPGGAALKHNGDGVWVNFAASKAITENFSLGVNGYWLKQLTGDTQVDGTKLDNAQESLYFGPGFTYKYDQKNVLNFNVYLPVYDKNSFSDGAHVNLQYVHQF